MFEVALPFFSDPKQENLTHEQTEVHFQNILVHWFRVSRERGDKESDRISG